MVAILAIVAIKLVGCLNRLLFTAAIIVLSAVILLQALQSAGATVIALISTLTVLILVLGGILIGGLATVNRSPILTQVLGEWLSRKLPPVRANPPDQLPHITIEQPAALNPSSQLQLPSPAKTATTRRPTTRARQAKRTNGDKWGF
jgi:hypothetical protein